MNSPNPIRRSRLTVFLTAAAACTLLFNSALIPAWAGKPGGGTPPVDSGTVYFRYYNGSQWQVWSMQPNGSARTPCRS